MISLLSCFGLYLLIAIYFVAMLFLFVEEQVIADLKDFSNNFKVSQLSALTLFVIYICVSISNRVRTIEINKMWRVTLS